MKEPELAIEAKEKRNDFFVAQNIWIRVKSLTAKEDPNIIKTGKFVFNDNDNAFDVDLAFLEGQAAVVSFHSTFLRKSIMIKPDGGYFVVDKSLFDYFPNNLIKSFETPGSHNDLVIFDELLTFCAGNINNKIS